MAASMGRQLPKMLGAIRKEHAAVEELVQAHGIDGIISDNRYGLWSDRVPTVFMTHQLRIRMPRSLSLISPVIKKINSRMIARFDACWVPDHAGVQNLSGDLSHRRGPIEGVNYIGPLSRFNYREVERDLDLLVALSGPEPQRSLFEEKVLSQLKHMNVEALVVQGMPGHEKEQRVGSSTVISHLDSQALNQAFSRAKVVVCRSGYSTLMDLEATRTNALLVPTPGQTEQIYLAEYHKKLGRFAVQAQNQLDLQAAISTNSYMVEPASSVEGLKLAVSGFLERVASQTK
jgi:predicted glycosyltransferase